MPYVNPQSILAAKMSVLPYVKCSNGKKYPSLAMGFEFELELQRQLDGPLPPFVNDAFRIDRDNSLRNFGYEFVSSPVTNVEEFLKSNSIDFIETLPRISSPRTSTHVHVNVSHFSLAQVFQIAFTYWLLEPVIMSFTKAHRRGNMFCTEFSSSGGIYRYLECFTKGYVLPNFDTPRYMGLNLAALRKLGTIEFRSLEGFDSRERVLLWSNMLHHLCDRAVRMESPWHIFKMFVDDKLSAIEYFLGQDFIRHTQNNLSDDHIENVIATFDMRDNWSGEEDFRVKNKDFWDVMAKVGYKKSSRDAFSVSEKQYQNYKQAQTPEVPPILNGDFLRGVDELELIEEFPLDQFDGFNELRDLVRRDDRQGVRAAMVREGLQAVRPQWRPMPPIDHNPFEPLDPLNLIRDEE